MTAAEHKSEAERHLLDADTLIARLADRYTAQWATEDHDFKQAEAHQRQARLHLDIAGMEP